jgi:purine-binding chemotaxis protein CheW
MTTTSAGQQGLQGIRRVCLFALGGEVFAVDVGCAKEVFALEEITVVPQTPSYVVGVANIRGHIVPILDVRPLLSLPRREVGPGTRVLVLEAAPLQAAIATEGVLGLAAFDEIMPIGDARPQQRSAFAIALLRRDQGPAILLDALGLLHTLRIEGQGPGLGRSLTPTRM